MSINQKIHDAKLAHWLSLFQEKNKSGLTVNDWCAKNGISTHTYYYWKRVAKNAYAESTLPEIFPLDIDAITSSQTTPPSDPDSCNLHELQNSQNLCNSHNLHNLHNLNNLHNFSELPKLSDTVSVSFNDVRIEIGSSASNEVILKIIEVLRHA